MLAFACMMGMALAAPPEQSSPNDPATILKALNEIVSTHRYGGPGPKLELAAEGMIVRTDYDGSVRRFRLRDIGEMSIHREGEAHVLLPCKDGALCVEWQPSPNASPQRHDMIVFSIYPADRGADVLRLFRELQAALAAKLVVATADTAPLISWSPREPRWGDTLVVTYNPGARKAAFGPGDEVFLSYNLPPRRGLRTVRLEREGPVFTGRVAVEEGASFVWGYVVGRHRFDINAKVGAMVVRPDGKPARGAMKQLMLSDVSPETYQSRFEKERALYPDDFSVYAAKWSLDSVFKRGEKKAIVDADLAEIEKTRPPNESPSLLFTLAVGNWYAGREEAGRGFLRRLAEIAPADDLTAEAIKNYEYQALSQQWKGDGPDEVRALAVKFIERNPGTTGARALYRSEAVARALSLETARSVCNAWISEEPDNPTPYFYLAEAERSKAGNPKSAEAAAARSAELTLAGTEWFYDVTGWGMKARLHTTYALLAQIRRDAGKYAEALADIKAAKGLTKDTRADYAGIEASIWAASGAADKAESCWLEAKALGHKSAEKEIRALYEKRRGSSEGFTEYLASKAAGPAAPRPAAAGGDNGGAGGAARSGRTPAPALILNTLDGREVRLAELKGKVVVFNFWFVGCAPCRAEIPGLNRLVDEYQGRNVVFLAVARDKAAMVREFLKEIPFKYSIVAEGVPTAEAFGVEVYPTHILIDTAGNIAHVLSGGSADKYQELAPLIDALRKAEGY